MPATHLSLYYHFVFSTRARHRWIKKSWQGRCHCFLGGIIRGLGGVAEEIGGSDDHVHILASLKAIHSVADIMRDTKSSSSGWVHDVIGNPLFEWQNGYGAFTVGKSEIETIRRYIQAQEEHHRKRTFQEEYLQLLQQSGIEYDERYLW